jgi:hypothetical protein
MRIIYSSIVAYSLTAAGTGSKQQEVRSKWNNATPLCHSGHRSGISYKTDPETDPETSLPTGKAGSG